MRFGIKGKIISVSLLSAFLCLIISYFGSMQLQKALNLYKVVAEVNFENVIDLGELEKAGIEIEAAANLLIGVNTTPKDAAVAQERLNTILKNFAKHSAEYESLPFVEGEEEAWKDFKNNFWASYVSHASKIIKLSATEKENDQKERDEFAATIWAKALKERPA
ncbi:MAG: MCP four helix bundle domain-containing protein [Bdellovibrionaceae bacterium]|nr:MCP four helix bundle domain-containing protein [Pseudobdellovibrionaceae bacterium]